MRFALATSDTRALTGQIFVHHFRRNTVSSAKMVGKMTRPHDVSLNWNRCQSPMNVANVSPMGHTRQNTGKPNTAVAPKAPSSVA